MGKLYVLSNAVRAPQPQKSQPQRPRKPRKRRQPAADDRQLCFAFMVEAPARKAS